MRLMINVTIMFSLDCFQNMTIGLQLCVMGISFFVSSLIIVSRYILIVDLLFNFCPTETASPSAIINKPHCKHTWPM